MSTVFGFVDLEKKQTLIRYGDFLDVQKKALVKALDRYKEQDPSIYAEIVDTLGKLMDSELFQAPKAMQERNMIALCTDSRWNWRHDNSFGSIEDIRKFLDTHPGYVIEDVYGKSILLPELEVLIRARSEV